MSFPPRLGLSLMLWQGAPCCARDGRSPEGPKTPSKLQKTGLVSRSSAEHNRAMSSSTDSVIPAKAPPENSVTAPRTYFRWIICGLLFFSTTVNYMDRQVISYLKEYFCTPAAQGGFGWTNTDFSIRHGRLHRRSTPE